MIASNYVNAKLKPLVDNEATETFKLKWKIWQHRKKKLNHSFGSRFNFSFAYFVYFVVCSFFFSLLLNRFICASLEREREREKNTQTQNCETRSERTNTLVHWARSVERVQKVKTRWWSNAPTEKASLFFCSRFQVKTWQRFLLSLWENDDNVPHEDLFIYFLLLSSSSSSLSTSSFFGYLVETWKENYTANENVVDGIFRLLCFLVVSLAFFYFLFFLWVFLLFLQEQFVHFSFHFVGHKTKQNYVYFYVRRH